MRLAQLVEESSDLLHRHSQALEPQSPKRVAASTTSFGQRSQMQPRAGLTKHTPRCPAMRSMHDTATRGEIAFNLAGRARVCKCGACLAQAAVLQPAPKHDGPPATSRDYTEQARRTRLPALRAAIKAKSARVAREEEQWLRDNPPSPTPPPSLPPAPLRTLGRHHNRSRHRLGVPLPHNASVARKMLYAKSLAADEPRAHRGAERDLEMAEQIFDELEREHIVKTHDTAAVNLATIKRRGLGLPSPPRTPSPPPGPVPFMQTVAAVKTEDWSGQWDVTDRGRMHVDYGKIRKTQWAKRHMPYMAQERWKWSCDMVREPEPEPEPEPEKVKKKKKRKIKTGWQTVDVSDLVRDRLMLRHVISSAVADGEVDSDERREIYKILARSHHKKKCVHI